MTSSLAGLIGHTAFRLPVAVSVENRTAERRDSAQLIHTLVAAWSNHIMHRVVLQVDLDVLFVCRPLSGLLCVCRRPPLVHRNEVGNEGLVPLEEWGMFIQPRLSSGPEVKPHPHATVVQLEPLTPDRGAAPGAVPSRSMRRLPLAVAATVCPGLSFPSHLLDDPVGQTLTMVHRTVVQKQKLPEVGVLVHPSVESRADLSDAVPSANVLEEVGRPLANLMRSHHDSKGYWLGNASIAGTKWFVRMERASRSWGFRSYANGRVRVRANALLHGASWWRMRVERVCRRDVLSAKGSGED